MTLGQKPPDRGLPRGDGADFEKEARAAEMRARPFYEAPASTGAERALVSFQDTKVPVFFRTVEHLEEATHFLKEEPIEKQRAPNQLDFRKSIF